MPAIGAERPFEVITSVSMEGNAGVVSADQPCPAGQEYQPCRGFMTAEPPAAMGALVRLGPRPSWRPAPT